MILELSLRTPHASRAKIHSTGSGTFQSLNSLSLSKRTPRLPWPPHPAPDPDPSTSSGSSLLSLSKGRNGRGILLYVIPLLFILDAVEARNRIRRLGGGSVRAFLLRLEIARSHSGAAQLLYEYRQNRPIPRQALFSLSFSARCLRCPSRPVVWIRAAPLGRRRSIRTRADQRSCTPRQSAVRSVARRR